MPAVEIPVPVVPDEVADANLLLPIAAETALPKGFPAGLALPDAGLAVALTEPPGAALPPAVMITGT